MNARQQGFNLISLMVGVSLSLVSILAMLSLYRNMIGISVLSIQDSKQDGQIAAGLLTAQRELLNAGFRIRDDDVPVANQIVLLSGATLNGATLSGTRQTIGNTALNGNAIIWMYKTSSTASSACAGLLVQDGVLSRLQTSVSSCTAMQWNSINWSASTLIAANQPATFFTAQNLACWPFGKTEAPASTSTLKRLQVIMSANTSTVDASSATQPAYVKSISTICLPNIETSL